MEYKEKLKDFGYLILVFLITVFFMKVVIFNGYVPSESMNPTLKPESIIIGNRLSKKDLDYGDIVIFTRKDESNEEKHYLVKRIVGLEGDKLELKNGILYRNGEALDEPYVSSKDSFEPDRIYDIPKGNILLMGDNRANSYDSRKWADPYVKVEDVYAKVFLNIYKWGVESPK